MTYQLIPLDRLRFGHDAVPPLNPRQVGRTADLETLAASLFAHGQGQAVNVRTIDGTHFVIDGNRRLAAMRLLAERGKMPVDHPVKADIDEQTNGRELSLALNLERVAMHEADTYLAFHQLAAQGLTDKQIASRFGQKPAEVRKMLALGALHETVLDAWRNGKLGYDTAAAFTLAASLKQQAELLRQLGNKQNLYAHAVREALGANDRRALQLLTFVGAEAYRSAGGRITTDLFGDKHVISDVEVLQRLVDAQLQAEIERLSTDGWSWVSKAENLPDQYYYSWERIRPELAPSDEEVAVLQSLAVAIGEKINSRWQCERDEAQLEAWDARAELMAGIAARSYTAEHKAASGAVVSINHESKLQVTLGVRKPAASKKMDAGPTAEISNALMNRLSVQLTLATRDTLIADPCIALAALVSALLIGGHQAVRASTHGMPGDRDQQWVAATFDKAFAAHRDLSAEELIVAAAKAVVPALDFTTHNALSPPRGLPGVSTLVDALPAERMNVALRLRFDASDYFAGASKTVVLRAIGEALGSDQEKKAGSMKKAELVKFAVAQVQPTGWLPPELRTAHYDGPVRANPLAAKPRVKRPAAAEQVAA